MDILARMSTNDMCRMLNEVGVIAPVKQRTLVIKLVKNAISEGKLEVLNDSLRAITPAKKRMVDEDAPTLKELLERNQVVANIVAFDSPRLMT